MKKMIFLILVTLQACSGSGGETPPAEIPAPVSHLSISSPDSDGLARVTAEAGFADNGTEVTITNTNSVSQGWVIKLAFAHATHTITANADGSFEESIEAQTRDEISVEFTKDGSSTSASTKVPENVFQLPQATNGEDVVYNPETGEAVVLGNDGTDGILTFFNLEAETSTMTTLDGISGANRIDLDIANQILVIADADDPDNVYHYHIPSGNTVANSTGGNQVVDLAVGADGNYSVIAFQSPTPAFAFYDQVNDFLAVDGDATDSDGSNQSEANTLDVDSNGDLDILALLSEGADGNFFLSTHEIDTSTPSFTQLTATSVNDLDSPGDLVFFNGASEVLVADSNRDEVIRVTPVSSIISTIDVGDNPRGLAVNGDNTEAYVVNTGDRILSVIDLSDSSVTNVLSLGLSPQRVAVDPTGTTDQVIILNNGDNTITLYNP